MRTDSLLKLKQHAFGFWEVWGINAKFDSAGVQQMMM